MGPPTNKSVGEGGDRRYYAEIVTDITPRN
jgi:hypothetical protein